MVKNKRNKNKTEIISFGQSNLLDSYDSAICLLASNCHPVERNLVDIFDCAFNFDKQIRWIVKTSFFQLRLISKVKA